MDELRPDEPKSEKPYTKYEDEILLSGAPSEQESADLLSNDLGHENRGSLELAEDKPEKKKFSTKKKIVSFMAGVAVGVGVIGVGDRLINRADRHGNPTKIGATANPGTSETATPSETQTAVPAEAKDFLANYGGNYPDMNPLSVYYAEKDYEAAHHNDFGHGGLLVTTEAIANYDPTAARGNVSVIGFERYNLPLSAKSDRATSMKIFNEYTSIQLSRLLNLLARNTGQEAQQMIENEFTQYAANSGANGFPDERQHNNEYVKTMIATAESIVSEYGPAANYTVAPGSAVEGDPNVTYFDPYRGPDVVAWGKNKSPREFQDYADIAISVDVYNGDSFTPEIDTIKSFQLVVDRHSAFPGQNFSTISIGQSPNF